MKYLLAILLLFSMPAMALDSCMTGSWYEEPGEGLSIEVLAPDQTIGYWYGYGTDGDVRWYTLNFDENGTGPIRTMHGGLQEVGSARIDAIDADTILFVYDIQIDVDNLPWCIGCVGDMTLMRLTQPVGCD